MPARYTQVRRARSRSCIAGHVILCLESPFSLKRVEATTADSSTGCVAATYRHKCVASSFLVAAHQLGVWPARDGNDVSDFHLVSPHERGCSSQRKVCVTERAAAVKGRYMLQTQLQQKKAKQYIWYSAAQDCSHTSNALTIWCAGIYMTTPVFSMTYTRLFSPPLGQDLMTKVHSTSFASKATWTQQCFEACAITVQTQVLLDHQAYHFVMLLVCHRRQVVLDSNSWYCDTASFRDAGAAVGGG